MHEVGQIGFQADLESLVFAMRPLQMFGVQRDGDMLSHDECLIEKIYQYCNHTTHLK